MKKIQILITAMMILLLAACQKEGKLLLKPIKASQPLSMRGFAVRDTIEQYFDGRKVREFSGRTTFTGRIIFDSDAPVLMELKKKGNPAVLFSKTIKQDSVEALKTFTFYYDGTKVTNTYNYPNAEPGVEQIALYFDMPKDMEIDLAYGDASGDVNALQYFKKNVRPNQWIDFTRVSPIEGGDIYLFVLKAGKREYLIQNNFERSYITVNLPTTYGGYQGGGVQSFYVNYQIDPSGNPGLISQELTSMYPR